MTSFFMNTSTVWAPFRVNSTSCSLMLEQAEEKLPLYIYLCVLVVLAKTALPRCSKNDFAISLWFSWRQAGKVQSNRLILCGSFCGICWQIRKMKNIISSIPYSIPMSWVLIQSENSRFQWVLAKWILSCKCYMLLINSITSTLIICTKFSCSDQ